MSKRVREYFNLGHEELFTSWKSNQQITLFVLFAGLLLARRHFGESGRLGRSRDPRHFVVVMVEERNEVKKLWKKKEPQLTMSKLRSTGCDSRLLWEESCAGAGSRRGIYSGEMAKNEGSIQDVVNKFGCKFTYRHKFIT